MHPPSLIRLRQQLRRDFELPTSPILGYEGRRRRTGKKILTALIIALTIIPAVHAITVINKTDCPIEISDFVWHDRREYYLMPITIQPGAEWQLNGIEEVTVTTAYESMRYTDLKDNFMLAVHLKRFN